MGRNNKSLNMQIHAKMEAMKSIGTKRHFAKSTGISDSIIPSYGTYENYKQCMKEFASYLENIRDIHSFNDVTQEIAKDYIKAKEIAGYSPNTYSKDISAINKIFNFKLNKNTCNVRNRSLSEITRSRNPVEMDKHVNPKNYEDQILIAKATGIRRDSMLMIKSEDFTFENGIAVSLNVKEKGGRERDIHILEKYQEAVTKIVEGKFLGQKIFGKYTKKIDNHAFRAEYARLRYEEICKNQPELCSGKRNKKGYWKEVLKVLSKDLGHNRTRVMTDNYLR